MMLFRLLFELIAFGIFAYQMKNSVEKVLDKPVIKVSSITSVDAISKPIFYICQDNQFSYTKAKETGYNQISHFTSGRLSNSDDITWKGRYNNMTFQKLQDTLFESDYSDLVHFTSILEKNIQAVNKVFHIPDGFCMKPIKTKKEMEFHTTKKTRLLLDDPNKVNNLMITRHENGNVKFGPTGDNTFDGYLYELKIEVHNHRIHDGISCTDYEKFNSTYQNCIESAFSEKLLDWYGCLPPWFPTNNTLTCDVHVTAKIPPKEADDEIFRFIKGMETNTFAACLPPCFVMKWTMKELFHQATHDDFAFLQVQIKDNVTVYTDVYAYDGFSLVIDLGSSLGLWLGLSALSIFDTVLRLFVRRI